ncbi:MAG: hypothetical protein JWP69_686 [Flaviaesturariibacter sp.]|nr:hypothetical protein [Flaviaesturariibacter sp.]
MKKLLLLTLLLYSIQTGAQTNPITTITITLPPNPDASTIKWGAGVLTISASAKLLNGRIDPRVEGSKLLVTIKKGGAKVCGTYTSNSAPAANFGSATKVWSGTNAVSLLGQDCTLPPGDYELSVQFFGAGPAGIMPLSEEKSKSFTIRATEQQTYQAPQAIAPANGTVLTEIDFKKPLTFRWTPVVPRPHEGVTYRLKVWQLMEGQSAGQAVIQQPILGNDVGQDATQFTIRNINFAPCEPPYTCNFIWNVQALNRDGKPIGGTNGTSEAFKITVQPVNDPPSMLTLISPANSAELSATDKPKFSWLHQGAPKGAPTFYKIKIVEIKGDQSPESAMRGNKPHFEKDSLVNYVFQYPETALHFEEGKRYAWRMEAKRNSPNDYVKRPESEINEFVVLPSAKNKITLTTPSNKAMVTSGSGLKFDWQLSTPAPSNVTYSIKIFEIEADQSPDNAIRGNKPHFERDSLIRPSFEYPLSAPGLKQGKRYAWVIQAKRAGVKITESEINEFVMASGFGCPRQSMSWSGMASELNKVSNCTVLVKACSSYSEVYTIPQHQHLWNGASSYVFSVAEQNTFIATAKQWALTNRPVGCNNSLKSIISITYFAYPIPGIPAQNKQIAFSVKYGCCAGFQNQEHRISLVSPTDGEVIPPGKAPQFSWFLSDPAPGAETDHSSGSNQLYKIKIVEIKGDESPEEALRSNKPHFEKDSLIRLSFEYPSSAPKFINGKSYAWNVETSDQQRKSGAENKRMSNAGSFSTGNGNKKSLALDSTTNSTDTTAQNPPLPPGPAGAANVGDTIRAGFDGEFLIAVTQMTTETDGSLTGKGTVTVNWLSTNIAVEFSKIRIDTTKRLTAGGIVTEKTSGVNYIQSWLTANATAVASTIPLDGVVNWTNNTVDNVVSWVNNNNFGLPPFKYQSNIAAPPIPPNSLKMPFGIEFDDADDKLMITEIIFKPNVSKVNFLVQKKFTKGVTDYKLGFAGKYFEIHPRRIDFSNGRVELVEDINVPNLVSDPKMKFTFKKGVTQTGCFVEWDSTGLKSVSLGMDVKFTRDWLLPVPTSNDSVKAVISGIGSSFKDILLTGSLPHCEIVGAKGTKLLADSICLDLSQTRNASAMYFPSNYTSDTSAQGKLLWEGLYIKTLKLTLPDAWKTGTNPTQITASHTLIDDFGVTMKVKAINIITFPMGRVSDMSASLDTVQISMLKGSLTDGSAKGKLVLPISRDTITNTLKYTATFAQVGGNNNFQIAVVPTGPIDADVLKGTMTLSQTSNITALLSDTAKSIAINLDGDFDWGNKDMSVTDTATATGGAPVRKKGIKGIKMEMAFQNISITYTNNSVANTNTMSFHPGSWSFASPQKRLANFPVSIKDVYYKSLPTVATGNASIKELVRGALMIDIVANLTDDIGGSTTVGGAFAIQINTSAKKFIPKFKGVFIQDIEVHADLPAVKINGNLKMYDNDAVYGDGFLATLGVTFNAISLQANALVQFGNTVYDNNNQFYRYWRAEADVKFSPGVPFLTGVGFYGFGGGAFYNMNAITVAKTAPEVGFKYKFVPQKSSLGFKAMATIGTMPKVETFNADVSLLAQFNQNTGGLTKIDFNGDFWLAAKLDERPSAKILGGLNINYTFPTKIFNLAGALAINAAPAIATIPGNPLGVTLHIDGYNNKWYFKCGTPSNTNDVKVLNMLNLYSYFMFGNDLGNDIPNGFTTGFVSNYNSTFPGHPISNSSDGGAGLTTTGAGIATGVGIKFDKSLSTSLPSGNVRNWNFNFIMKSGAELNAALLQYSGACAGFNPVGIRGFRASGSVGFYAQMTGTLNGTVKNRNNKVTELNSLYYWNDKSFNICDIRGGGWLTGAFPNPEYFQGAIDGKVGLFDDLVDINFHKDFTYGDDCGAMAAVAGPAIVETDTIANLKNKLIQYVTPSTQFNFPLTAPIIVKYNLVPNQVFDVAEMQASGSIKNRTFKLVVTKSLEVKDASGVWIAVTHLTKANNIGEYQYYAKPPLNTGPLTLQTSMAITAITTNLNANSSNSLISTNGLFNSTLIVYPVPPPPPPNYPNPVPPPVNSLLADKDYRFIVTATLKELIGSTWNTAVTKVGSSPVTETKTKTFRTGPMQMLLAGSTGPKNNLVK